MFEDFRCTAAPVMQKAQTPAPALPPQKQAWEGDSLTYTLSVGDNLDGLRRVLPVVLPYVDRAIVLVAGGSPAVGEFLQSLGPKILTKETPDTYGGWFLRGDTLQVPSQDLLGNLRKLIEASEKGTKFSEVEFREHAVLLGPEGKILEDKGLTENYTRSLVKFAANGAVARCDHYFYRLTIAQ